MRTPFLEYEIPDVVIKQFSKPDVKDFIAIPTTEDVTRMATQIVTDVMQKSAQSIGSVSPASQGFFSRQRSSVMKMIKDYKNQIQEAKRKYQTEMKQTVAYMRDAAIVLNYYKQIKNAARDGVQLGDIFSLVPSVDAEKRDLSAALEDEIGSYTTDMQNVMTATFSKQMHNGIPMKDPYNKLLEAAENSFIAENYTSTRNPPMGHPDHNKPYLDNNDIIKYSDMKRNLVAQVRRLEYVEDGVRMATRDFTLGREVLGKLKEIMDTAGFNTFNPTTYAKLTAGGEIYKPLWDKYDWLEATKKLGDLEADNTPDDLQYQEMRQLRTKINMYIQTYTSADKPEDAGLRDQAEAIGEAINEMGPNIEKRTKLGEVAAYVRTATDLSASVGTLLKADSPYQEHLGNIKGYLNTAARGLEIAKNFEGNVNKIKEGVNARLKNPLILLNDMVKLTMEIDKSIDEDLEIEMEYVPGITDKLFNQFNDWFAKKMDQLKEWLVNKITSLTNAVKEKMETAYQAIQTRVKVTAMSAIPGTAFGGAQMSQALNT